jgi:hypothetical protein
MQINPALHRFPAEASIIGEFDRIRCGRITFISCSARARMAANRRRQGGHMLGAIPFNPVNS